MSISEQNNLRIPSQVLQKNFSLPLAEIRSNGVEHQITKKNSNYNTYAFKFGDLGLILESETVVSEVIDSLPMCSIPNSPRWLFSMANLRGTITPIFNLLDIFGFTSQISSEDKKILIIGVKENAVGILIDEIPFRIVLKNSDEVALSANLPEKLAPHVRCCYEKDDAIWVDWDVASFFQSLKLHY